MAGGTNKGVRGLLAVPEESRSALLNRALEAGAGFHSAAIPGRGLPLHRAGELPWFRLGFPLSCWSDVLKTVLNLVELGYTEEPFLEPALDWLRHQRDKQGRWKLENSLKGQVWVDIKPVRHGKLEPVFAD